MTGLLDTCRRTVEKSLSAVAEVSACYEVIAASDPGDGLTESLTLSPVAARDYKADRTVVSFLTLCRLERDEIEIRYPSSNAAEATIEIRELPMEAPIS